MFRIGRIEEGSHWRWLNVRLTWIRQRDSGTGQGPVMIHGKNFMVTRLMMILVVIPSAMV
ncbi:MAG: hypothetical protein ACP5I4_13180 [Oceanipulchritudo sp.]